MKFVSLAVLLSFLLGSVSARSTGAGGCSVGSASPAVGHGGSSSGSLSDGSYVIQVDGQTVTNAATVTAGETFTVTITGPTFKGFLVIIDGEDSSAITSFGAGGKLATESTCSGKAAATHVTAGDKTSVAVQADIDSAKTTTLELNIVVAFSTYYYTQISLTVEGGSGPTPVASPVAQPTTCENSGGLFLFGTKGC